MSSKSITFAVYSDTHLGQFATRSQMEEMFETVNRMVPSIQLLIHLGDITNSGKIEEFNDFIAAREVLNVKSAEILGNHDRNLIENHRDEVEKHLGGLSFSREIKGWGLCGISNDDDEDAWHEMFSELEDLARAGRRLAFVHSPPKPEFIEDASDAGVRAIFYGHRHCTRVQVVEGVEVIGTPAALFGGIDNTPASVRLIHCKGSRIWTELRPIGMEPLFNCQSATLRPEGGGHIEVVAYDPVFPIRKVTAKVGEGRSSMTMPLKPHGPWTFMVRLPTGLKKTAKIQVTAEREGADALELSSKLKEQAVVEPKNTGDWHHPRLEPGGNAFLPASLLGKPELIWTSQVSGMLPGGGSSNLVIASGKIFVPVSDFSANSVNGIVAVSVKNGRFLWKSDSEGMVRGGCSYGVLVGSEGALLYNDILGRLQCISAEDGSRKWQYRYQGIEGWVHTSPLVEAGRVYAGTAGDLVCLSLGSGQKVWRAKSLGKDWMVSLSGVAVDDERLYIALMKSGLVSLRKKDGGLVWQLGREKYGAMYAPVLVQNDRVFTGTDQGNVLAVNAKSGKVIWDEKISGSAINAAPVSDGKRVFFVTLSGSVTCMDAETGEMAWQIRTQPGLIRNATYRYTQPSISSSPVLTGEILHVAAMDGKLRGISVDNGNILYTVDCGGPVGAGLCVTGNSIVLPTYDGRLQCWAFPDMGADLPTTPAKPSKRKKPQRKRAEKKPPVRKPRPNRRRGGRGG